MAKKGEDTRYSKEISNNILVLILIVIIFVSLLGTLIVKQTIDTLKTARAIAIPQQTNSGNAGMVALSVLPSEEQKTPGSNS